MINKLKHITVSEKNYFTLKSLGNAGVSLNDVVTEVLNKIGVALQFDSRVPARDQIVTTTAIASSDNYRTLREGAGGRSNDD